MPIICLGGKKNVSLPNVQVQRISTKCGWQLFFWGKKKNVTFEKIKSKQFYCLINRCRQDNKMKRREMMWLDDCQCLSGI